MLMLDQDLSRPWGDGDTHTRQLPPRRGKSRVVGRRTVLAIVTSRATGKTSTKSVLNEGGDLRASTHGPRELMVFATASWHEDEPRRRFCVPPDQPLQALSNPKICALSSASYLSRAFVPQLSSRNVAHRVLGTTTFQEVHKEPYVWSIDPKDLRGMVVGYPVRLAVHTASLRLFGAHATAMILAMRGPLSPPLACTRVFK